ncbi:MAG: Gfo/Idh/MocA family oxidoreductase [Pseudonocardiales bacterium]|jgi:predicted dehydrogenase|nr:Gfo/Idh/MocA family oxidoreductase [Pseudonocardiales bacterium]
MTVRWGVVGPGRIAAKVVADFGHVPGAEVVAVASRSAERAQAFATEHGIARAHGSYRAIVEDEGVDVLYVATPHPQHRAVTLAAIAAGKAVLVEKAFTVTPAATREIVDAARARGVFVMEAMWTRFQPAIARLRDLVDEGAIGPVQSVQADLGAQHNTDPADRFYNPDTGGGALFDVGVYPISFAQMLLGTPETVTAHGVLAATGVDVEEAVLLGWPDGRSAALLASLRCATPGTARVIGTAGWIDVPPRFHHPHSLVLARTGREPETIAAPPLGAGYAHELIEVTECVAAGRTESAVMPLADTVAVQDVMAAVATQLGLDPREGPGEL